MQALLALTVLLTLGAAAQAKPTPVERIQNPFAPDESAMLMGPAAAMLESDYFRMPQTPFASDRVFPCRLQLRIFDKTRLARSCH